MRSRTFVFGADCEEEVLPDFMLCPLVNEIWFVCTRAKECNTVDSHTQFYTVDIGYSDVLLCITLATRYPWYELPSRMIPSDMLAWVGPCPSESTSIKDIALSIAARAWIKFAFRVCLNKHASILIAYATPRQWYVNISVAAIDGQNLGWLNLVLKIIGQRNNWLIKLFVLRKAK